MGTHLSLTCSECLVEKTNFSSSHWHVRVNVVQLYKNDAKHNKHLASIGNEGGEMHV